MKQRFVAAAAIAATLTAGCISDLGHHDGLAASFGMLAIGFALVGVARWAVDF